MSHSPESAASASDRPFAISATPHTLASVLAAIGPLAILGLPSSLSLTDSDVRRAYHSLALQFHPDKTSTGASSTRDETAAAFIRISSAYESVRTEATRRQVINDAREAEIWREMQLKKERDAADSAAATVDERGRSQPAAKRRPAARPSHTAFPQASDAPSAAAPSAAFPSFAGARFKPSSYTFQDPASAAAASSASSSPSSVAAVPARPSFDVTSSAGSADFASELSRWLRAFAASMAAERSAVTANAQRQYGSEESKRQVEGRIGAKVFSHTAPRIEGGALVTTSASTAATAPSSAAPASAAPAPSRLQQLRARQQGVPVSTLSASAASSSSSAPAGLPASVSSLLSTGARFRLRTLAAVPGAAPTKPVPVAVWCDSECTRLQWRLVSSAHARPDGAIEWTEVASVKKVNPTSAASVAAGASSEARWFSIVQKNGQTMTLEATSNEVREQWIGAIEAVIKVQQRR